jgi:hypothetical protein
MQVSGQIHPFATSALIRSFRYPLNRLLGITQIVLGALEKGNFSRHCRESNSYSSVVIVHIEIERKASKKLKWGVKDILW